MEIEKELLVSETVEVTVVQDAVKRRPSATSALPSRDR